jgi:hypothetical protein
VVIVEVQVGVLKNPKIKKKNQKSKIKNQKSKIKDQKSKKSKIIIKMRTRYVLNRGH